MIFLIFPVVLLVFIIAWLAAEVRAGLQIRITLGMVCMAVLVYGWFVNHIFMTDVDAVHRAIFRKMESAFCIAIGRDRESQTGRLNLQLARVRIL
jgi:hypothetical protein